MLTGHHATASTGAGARCESVSRCGDGRGAVGDRRRSGASGALDFADLASGTRGQALADVSELRSRLDAQLVELITSFATSGESALDGAASPAAWMRHHLRLAPGTARQQVRTASSADELPAMRAALVAGHITVSHLDVVVNAMNANTARRVSIREAEGISAEAAKQCDPVELSRLVRHWAHTVDPLGELASENAAHEARRLPVSRTFAGAVTIEGLLPPEAGAIVLTALEALGTEDFRVSRRIDEALEPGSRSTPTQRRADSLVELCRRYVDSGIAPEINGVRPHLALTVGLEALAAGNNAVGIDPPRLEGVGAITAEAGRRISCDATRTAFTVDASGMPLSYGRTQRTVPPSMRRYLVLRDRGCAYPGCDRPPAWTQAHHLVHWARGGETSVTNLALLCTFHHHVLHEGGFTSTGSPENGTLQVYRPDGTTLEPPRRPPGDRKPGAG